MEKQQYTEPMTQSYEVELNQSILTGSVEEMDPVIGVWDEVDTIII